MADVLKEFLVKIGYHVDKESQHKFFENLGETVKRLGEVAAKVEVTAGLMAAAFVKMGESVEKTYFTASRAGASVAGLEAFRFAAGRLGITAEEAVGSLTTLGNRLKDYPALRASIERRAGVAGLGHNVDQLILTDIPNILRGMAERGPMGEATARNYARDILGVSPNFVDAVKNREEWEKQVETYQKISRSGGRDPNDVKGWLEFMDQVAQLDVRFTSIKNALGTALSKNLVPVLKDFGDYMDKNGEKIAKVVSDIAVALSELAIAIAKAILALGDWMAGSEGWAKAFEVLAVIVGLRLVPGLWGMVTALGALVGIAIPGWLLALLGIGVVGTIGTAKVDAARTAADPSHADATFGEIGGDAGSGLFGTLGRGIKGGWNRLFGGGGGGGGANLGEKGFWTKERIKHSVDRLVNEAGISPVAAAALVANFAKVEAAGGPTSFNPEGGSLGARDIAQWRGSRQMGLPVGNKDLDVSLSHVVKELTPGTPEYARADSQRALAVFRMAKTAEQALVGVQMYERGPRVTDPKSVSQAYDIAYGGAAPVQGARTSIDPRKFGIQGIGGASIGGSGAMGITDLPLNLSDISRTPGGEGDTTTQNSRSLTINQNVTNNVNGAKDPKATGEEVASKMGRPIADVQSNFFSGAQ